MANKVSGSTRTSGDKNLASNRPTRIWSVAWLSGSNVATLVLRSGTAASDVIYYQKSGLANDTRLINFENGLLFPNGVFYDHSTLATFATFEYEVEL